MKVTLFKKIELTTTGYIRDVTEMLDRIRTGNSKDIVEELRANKDKAKEIKKQLPVICFSGEFGHRSASGLKKHSGLICLDFDKFETDELLKTTRDTLQGDEYTFALFTSPSGDGLKLVVKIPANALEHKQYFQSLEKYYNHPNFDKATSDVVRACFESYDPELYYNPESSLWTEKEEQDFTELGTNTPTIAIKSKNEVAKKLLTWWNKKFGHNKGSRNANLFKLAIALNDFGVEKSEAISICEQFIESDFPQSEVHNVVNNGYKKEGNFNTRFFEDSDLKRAIEQQVFSGREDKDIVKQFPDLTKQQVLAVVDEVRQKENINDFWYYDDRNKIKLSHKKFRFFLEQRNIFKYYPNNGESFMFVKIEENKVSVIYPEQIKDLVLTELDSRTDIGMQPYELMAGSTSYFKDNYLNQLSTIDFKLKKDTIDTCYLYYRDSAVMVKKDSITRISYIDLDGYVWKNQIIDRDFNEADYHGSEFMHFLSKVSNDDQERFTSLCTIIGYELHSFKTSANNKCIILNDETISENPNGGSGKGLFCQSIGHVKRVGTLDGKQFDFGKSFPYQTVNVDTQVLVFDDVKRNFPFENLFSLITEGITLEQKNKTAIKINVKDSPKIIITTNYTIKGSGGSFERRKFEVEFSNYFGSHHAPLDEYGRMMFDEWEDEDWLKFDNFMVKCIQLYLSKGLAKSKHNNLELRQFINNTDSQFHEWCIDENLPSNVMLSKKEKYDKFTEEYPDFKRGQNSLSQKKFAAWIEHWATYQKLSVVKGKSGSNRWIMIKDETKPIVESLKDVF